jgi:hypothetical protein
MPYTGLLRIIKNYRQTGRRNQQRPLIRHLKVRDRRPTACWLEDDNYFIVILIIIIIFVKKQEDKPLSTE